MIHQKLKNTAASAAMIAGGALGMILAAPAAIGATPADPWVQNDTAEASPEPIRHFTLVPSGQIVVNAGSALAGHTAPLTDSDAVALSRAQAVGGGETWEPPQR
jgi:hypothetical protein